MGSFLNKLRQICIENKNSHKSILFCLYYAFLKRMSICQLTLSQKVVTQESQEGNVQYKYNFKNKWIKIRIIIITVKGKKNKENKTNIFE